MDERLPPADGAVARERTVLLVDDDAIVRSWVRISLAGSEFRLVAEATSVAEAVELAQAHTPDLLLVDYRLGDGVGTELVRELRDRGIHARAVVMSAAIQHGLNESAHESGAHGTVLKTGKHIELLLALRRVSAGGRAFDRRHPKRARKRGSLSPREREILLLVAGGATNREIATKLNVGHETVKTLLGRTFDKLGVHKRAEAVAAGHRLGLL